MKKLLGIIAVAAIVVSFSACKKDYTCTCTYDGGSYKYTMTESKGAAAKAVCEGKGIGPIQVDGVTVPEDSSEKCTLD
ncbi:MAG: hypothetical protein A2033_09895 [Bacteroidetes bacterium GWA2_31_9]|nr:MAG: hypothetical protein A2033_09895 [Bacteroidetes bacterium GWA2_31_9]